MRIGEVPASWDSPILFEVIGAAAAQTRGCVVDLNEDVRIIEFPSGTAVLVAGETLMPVARPGQWALLADEVTIINEGDLVAVADRYKNHYLRRIWSNGDAWILEAVNPLAGLPPVLLRKCECMVRRINGISFEPRRNPGPTKNRLMKEWLPRNDFATHCLDGKVGISINGTSIEPIACHDQIVLVGRKIAPKELRPGALAVLETEDHLVGNVIKRAFPSDNGWLLASLNPFEAHDPIAVACGDIRAIWPVCGVLFVCE